MKKKISIEGMSCTHCANNVKEALKGVPAAKRSNYTLRIKTNQNNDLSIL